MRSVKDIVRQASLFNKKASIETDMAKRIMLSIIPVIRSKSEVSISGGGYDPVALRSAVRGAKDLIKYGSLACFDELLFYPDKYANEEGMELSYEQEQEYRKKRDAAKQVVSHARQLADEGQYTELLRVCDKAFWDVEGWSHAFGGKAWGKISRTLLSIANKYAELNSPEVRQDPEKEFEIMKEIVVDMNVFDGLAHNNGKVMPKVLERELSEHPELEGAYSPGPYHTPYSLRVQKMMDAKELENPIDVYKQIEHIIADSPHKMVFRDWITKLRRHPDYAKQEDADAVARKLGRIRGRKGLLDRRDKLLERLDKLGTTYRTYVSIKVPPKAPSEMGVSGLLGSMVNQKKELTTDLYDRFASTRSAAYSLKAQAESMYRNEKIMPREILAMDSLYAELQAIEEQFYGQYANWRYSNDYFSQPIPRELSDEKVHQYYRRAYNIVQQMAALALSL